MQKIKVYMVSYLFPAHTWATIQALNLSKRLREKGVEITFITGAKPNNKFLTDYEGFKLINLKHILNRKYLTYLSLWGSMLYVLIRDYKKYDIVHSYGIDMYNNIVSLYCKYLRKKSIVKTTLSDEVKNLSSYNNEAKFNFFLMKLFDKIISLSKDITEGLIASKLNKNNIEYIPNGVDFSIFKPPDNLKEKEAIRKSFNISNGIIFSYIGVIHKRKRIDWMMKLWFEVFKEIKDTYLIIGGGKARENIIADGGGSDYYKNIRKFIDDNKLEKKIILLPFRRNVENYFKISDFFINPSLSEGLSNSMLEAMACGVIPITSKTSGAKDIILNGVNGFLFNINDSNSFLKILTDIYRSQEKWKDISEKAKETVRNSFDLNLITEKYLNLYRHLIK